jgi:hypothetical protein
VNCFRCRKELASVFHVEGEPDDCKIPNHGLIFEAHGNYGSRVYDPTPVTASAPSLVVWICDECMREHRDLVLMHETSHADPVNVWTGWDPDALPL